MSDAENPLIHAMSPEQLKPLARRISARPWRVVEAQHRASTMRLVDTLDEQATLEDLLDASKPPSPTEVAALHYLLATPFRYPAPPPAGSRFRGIGDAGVWYGADEIETSLAEIAYWRMRFLADSPGTPDLPPVPHTVFRASVAGLGIVLFTAPLDRQRKRWQDPRSYDATHELARTARAAKIALIRYRSVRDPQHRPAIAVLSPRAFRDHAPLEQQTWLIKASRARVLAESSSGRLRLSFDADEVGLA